MDIWGSSLPLFSKLDLIFCYFGIRKFATHWVSLGFFCTIVPLSVFTPEVRHDYTCQLPACVNQACGHNLFRLTAIASQTPYRVGPHMLLVVSGACYYGRFKYTQVLAFSTYCACIGVQVSIPLWALVHLPVVVTVTTAVFTPKGWLHCILYVLFENAMGIVKMGAVVAGGYLGLAWYACDTLTVLHAYHAQCSSQSC